MKHSIHYLLGGHCLSCTFLVFEFPLKHNYNYRILWRVDLLIHPTPFKRVFTGTGSPTIFRKKER